MAAPLARETRNAITDDIRAGELGRNAIARKHGVSAGVVSKIARAEWLCFDNAWMTATGSEARRIDCAAVRVEREAELFGELMALPQTYRERDGRETKAYRRISYKLYDVQRHHRGSG